MSNDVASLVLKVDSTAVVSGTTALDKFALSATRAGKSAGAITQAGSLARHELINLSRQIQDVGVSLVSGQSPFMVLAQQGTQIADIFGSSKTASVGGALKQVVTGIGGARLAALGIAGALAGGAFAAISLADGLKKVDDVARAAGTSLSSVQGIMSAASFKGIGKDDSAKALSDFGAAVFQAKNNMGGLAEVFRANNVQAKSFDDYLLKAADLIKNASSDAQRLALLQEMGLPATMQWVRFLSQGADGIKAAIKAAGEFNDAAEQKLVDSARRFDEAWNTFTTKAGNRIKGWAVSAIEAAGSVSSSILTAMQGTYGSSGGAAPKRVLIDTTNLGTGRAGKVKTFAERQREISLEQPLLGLLGTAPTAKQVQEKGDKDDRDNKRAAA